MVALQFLRRNEMNDRVVIGEVVRHRLDFALDSLQVGALFRDDETFAQVLFASRQRRIRAAPSRRQGRVERNRVLLRVQNAVDSADRVGVPLTDAASPERVVDAVRKDRAAVKSSEREHAGVPTARDQRDLAAFLRGGVDRGEVFRNLGVRVETVDDVEEARQFRRLFRQIGRASAAKDKNVDFVLHFGDFIDRVNADAFG